MNCRGVSRRLSAYIDNNLSPGIKQGVAEHLQHCLPCQRRLSEFEAIVTAAHSLVPLSVSEGFCERVLSAINSRRESREVLGVLRYRLTLAGVAFMVTSAAIFFIVGPPSSNITPSFSGTQDSLMHHSASGPDFYSHPELKVSSFPIPESAARNNELAGDQNLLSRDTLPRPNEFILPNVQKVNENVDGKF